MDVETIIRFLLLCFCIYGYIEYISEKFNIKKEVIPVVVFSTIGSCIFLSGILNAMSYVGILIFGCGIVLGVIHIYQLFKNKKSLKVSFALIVFLVLILYLFIWLKDMKYYAFDNFSYWGLIVKNLMLNSQLPNYDDTLIVFQSYPPGSACFIWFVCKVVGYSEGHTLFAQALYIISCGIALLGLIDDKHRGKRVLPYMVVIYMCLCSITMSWGNNIYNLLVDIMLAAIAIAAFSIVEIYKDDVIKATWLVCPLIIFEVCVKNSGLIWVLAIAGLLLYHQISLDKKIKKDSAKILVLCVAVPLVVRKIWDLHVKYVYPDGENTFHAMSIEHYTNIFSEKTKEDLRTIHDMFIARVCAFDNKFFWILACYFFVGALLFIFNRKILVKSKYWFYVIYSIIIYVVYQIGNYCMYMFSMPLGESLYLAAYDRYVMTVEWFAIGIFVIYSLKVVSCIFKLDGGKKNNIIFVGIVLTMCVSLRIETSSFDMLIKKPIVEGRDVARDNLDSIIEKYNIESEKSYLIYISNQTYSDSGYRKYMAKYLLYSNDVNVISTDEFKLINNDEIKNYDYFIVLDKDDFINEWLEDNNFPNDCIVVSEEFS